MIHSGRRHSITIAGSKLCYWVYGPTLGAPVIIAIHGFRGTHHGLERVIQKLPQYTIIAPDLPGFGESSPMIDQRHDIDGYVQLFRKFIPKVTRPDEPVYLLGHSFGSIVAAKLVGEGLIHFNGLILINPIATRPQIVGRLGSVFYFWLGHHLGEDRARTYFSWPHAINMMSLTLTKTRHQPTKDYIKAQHLAHFSQYSNRQTLHESFKASVTHTVGEHAANITIPTLLIVGDRDEIAPLKSQQRLYSAIQAPTELAIVERTGHLLHYEKSTEAADFIRAFIGN